MKKKVVFLITAIIMFALLLSGCGNKAPERRAHWKQMTTWQELVYDVSVVDETNSIAPQNSGYTEEAYRQGIYDALKLKDEIRPQEISGTYTTRIRKTPLGASTNDFESILDIFITYSIDGIIYDLNQEFKGQEETNEEAVAAFIEKLEEYNETNEGFAVITDSTITVHTVVTSTCTFSPENLSPVITASEEDYTSTRTVQGVYVGKRAQEINDYSISCNYITEKNKTYCQYTYENNLDSLKNETGRFQYTNSKSAPVYDSNLFFLAPRLYEHTAVTSGVPYSVIEPLQKKGVESFTLGGYSDNTLKIRSLDIYKAAIYITVKGGTQFSMVVDTQAIQSPAQPIRTYTPLMIQQDWLLFTLQEEYIPAEAQVAPEE